MSRKNSDAKKKEVNEEDRESDLNRSDDENKSSEKGDAVDYGKLMQEARKVEKESELNGEEVKTKEKDKEKTKEKEQESKSYLLTVILPVLVVIFAIVLALSFQEIYPAEQKSVFVGKDHFKRNLNDLRAKFTNQSPYLWKSVGKLGADHIDEVQHGKAKRPLVFLLVSSNKNERVLGCMANKIALSFSVDGVKNQPPVVMNGNDIANAAHSKESLDEKLGNELTKNKGVVVITKIGSLSYDTASIFFKYCDNEGAPHPNAVFIFTLSLPGDDDLVGRSNKEITSATWRHLRSVVWKDGESASADALIARIVDPSPILVLTEDEAVINICPVDQ